MAGLAVPTIPALASGSEHRTIYVSSSVQDTAGDRTTPGTRTAPLRSLAQLNSVGLRPGDRVLLKRGDRFDGGVSLAASGRSGAPVTIGSYGKGPRPIVAGGDGIQVLGNWVVIHGIRAQGSSFAGIGITGDHVTITSCSTTGNAAGIYIREGADDATVSRCNIFNNRVMSVNTPGGQDDSGAFGILVRGDRARILGNRITGQHAESYDYGTDGSAIEIYGARKTLVANNVAADNNTFSELGNSRTADTTFRHNTVTGSQVDATFVITRGAKSNWGPIADTNLIDNNVVLTGAKSQGFVCCAGCDNILTLHGNDITAKWKVGYADGRIVSAENTYRVGQRQFAVGPTDNVPGSVVR